jgi:triosephosphate isomerase
MLAKLFVAYVIVGHSERRELFGETDEWVNQKVKAVIKHGMTPIMCVGETLEEREAERTFDKVGGQVVAGLQGVAKDSIAKMVIAYEPIWAIGTGKTATAEDAQAVCGFIRSTVAETFGAACADGVRIQYGGSVKAANAAELMAQPDVDGLLVGGASLDADEFARVCKFRQSGLNAVINAAETGEVPAAVKVVPDLAPPPLSPADMSAEWLVNAAAAFGAAAGQPLSDDDLTILKSPSEAVSEHADLRDKLGELHNRLVIVIRNGIDGTKQSGTVQQVELRKGLRVPQDWAYHLGVVREAHQGWLVCSIVEAALGRNLLAGERRDWRSK